MNYYNLLGLSYDATQDEIRKTYFELAKIYHPDTNDSIDTKEKFIQIQRAYEVLSNEETRKEYNKIFDNDKNKEANIQVNAYYSRSSIPLISESQLFYLLLDIFSTEAIDEEVSPYINLCIVIDRSTSMQGVFLNNLKSQVVDFVRLLKSEDTVSIISFSDNAEIVVPPCKIRDIQPELKKIKQITASGSTEIFKGLNKGVGILKELEGRQVKFLLLITDGHTYGDENNCIQLIKEANNAGIIFQAIGVGLDWNDDFLDTLSGIAGGETQFVTTSQELNNILREKIKNFGVIFSKTVKISLNLNSNVKLNYAFRLNPDLSKLDIGKEINLGSLYSEKHLRIIFEFIIEELPIDMSELRISHGSIKITTPSKTIETKRFFYDFKRQVLPKLEEEKIPPVIVDGLSKLSLYRLQEKAREDILNGEYELATKRLNNLATHLLSLGNTDLAKTIIKEVEFLHDTRHFSELGMKKMKYGTRSLIMLPEPKREVE